MKSIIIYLLLIVSIYFLYSYNENICETSSLDEYQLPILSKNEVLSKTSVKLILYDKEKKIKEIGQFDFYQIWFLDSLKNEYIPNSNNEAYTQQHTCQFKIGYESKEIRKRHIDEGGEYAHSVFLSTYFKKKRTGFKKGFSGIAVEFTFQTVKDKNDQIKLLINGGDERRIYFLNSNKAIQLKLSSEVLNKNKTRKTKGY